MTNFNELSFEDVVIGATQHFIISLVAGYVLYLGYRKYLHRVVIAAILVIFIDLDHFSPFIDLTNDVKMFHNLSFAFILPLILMSLFYIQGRKNHQYGKVFTASLFFVMLSGHVFWDGLDETPVLYFYPLSTLDFKLYQLFDTLTLADYISSYYISILYYVLVIGIFNQVLQMVVEDEKAFQDTIIQNDDEMSLFPMMEPSFDSETTMARNDPLSYRKSVQLTNSISRPRNPRLY